MNKNEKKQKSAFRLFLIAAVFLVSCETGPEVVLDDISGSTQRAVYNGRPIPFIVEPGFSVRYFTAPEAPGSTRVPVEPGTYIVRVEHSRAPGNYAEAALVIEKASISFLAEKNQLVRYDGSPKRVLVSTEPPVSLSYSYYPTEEIREEAIRTFLEEGRRQTAVQGFRRINHAPIGPGTYYAAVYFAGNDRYRPAVAELDFTILGRNSD
jgi:hypothetical protein